VQVPDLEEGVGRLIYPQPEPVIYLSVTALEQLFRNHVAWTSGFPLGLTVVRAEGPFLYLEDGRRIIDLISGIAVSSLGHRHPAVIRAIHDQVDRHLHVMVYGEFIQRPQVEFAARLASQLPASLQVVYFFNKRSAANEGALNLANK
jgi:acetylornithine/N-succinyldiaminopimelate aminotransferase